MKVARERDRRAWMSDIVDRYEGPLVRYAARITGDLHLAGDVVQETFLRLCRKEERDEEDHIAEWLFTVCRNRAIDALRRGKYRRSLNGAEPPETAVSSPDTIGKREEEDRMVKELEQLPKPQQEVLRLKFQEGLSYREIGRITGNSVTNVGFLIHTGLKRLRERLAGADLTPST
ncbi:MAG: hypothetical protein A2Z34_07225 [Planctomycetes bacterium RBG_16_59_8]|nr:MAG: hypothetical protein A2Z34_07225 [Planctomycetes bacterium RBG_16_59_8]